MRIVVVDSNSIVRGPWHLGSAGWRVLLYQSRLGLARVVVPEVVVREAVGRFADEAAKRAAEADQLTRKYRSLTGSNDDIAQTIDVDAIVQQYEASIRSRLTDSGVIVAELPEVDLMTLVDRAIYRRRPFDEKGSGFRDSLIWEVLQDEWRKYGITAEMWLVSKDGNAYSSTSSPEALHEDLFEELAERGFEGPFRLTTSIESYLDAVGVSDPRKVVEVTALVDAEPGSIGALVKSALVGTDLPSTTFNVSATVVGVDDVEIAVAQLVGVDENGAGPMLAHLVVRTRAEIEVTLLDYATPQQATVSALVEIGATAVFDENGGTFNDLTIDPPALELIPEILGVVARDAHRYQEQIRNSAGLPRDLAEQIRAMNNVQLPKGLLEQIRAANNVQLPKGLLEQIRAANNVQLPKGLLQQIRAANNVQLPKGVAEQIRAFNQIPDGVFEQIRRLSWQSDTDPDDFDAGEDGPDEQIENDRT